MARDLGDAAGQTYPRTEWPVIEAPVRPIGAFRAGMAGSAEPEIATFAMKFPHFGGPRFRRRDRADLSADRMARYRSAGSTDWGLPGRDGRFRGARNRGFPRQIPPFYGREMADFG